MHQNTATRTTMENNVTEQTEPTELRDYFAAHAMQAFASRMSENSRPESLAKEAYRLADAMIEARDADPTAEEIEEAKRIGRERIRPNK